MDFEARYLLVQPSDAAAVDKASEVYDTIIAADDLDKAADKISAFIYSTEDTAMAETTKDAADDDDAEESSSAASSSSDSDSSDSSSDDEKDGGKGEEEAADGDADMQDADAKADE